MPALPPRYTGAWCGRLTASESGVLLATNQGALCWIDGRWLDASPAADVLVARQGNGRLVAGPARGLWLDALQRGGLWFGEMDGLPDCFARDVALARDGGLWVATAGGLAWVSPDETAPAPIRRS